MGRRRVYAILVIAVTVVSASTAAVIAARTTARHRRSDRAGPGAASRKPEHRAPDQRADEQDDVAGQAQPADAAVGRADHRRRGEQAGRGRVQPHRSGEDQPLPAPRDRRRGCTSRSCSRTTRFTGTGRSSRSHSGPRAASIRTSPSRTTGSAPLSRRRSASSRSTARWSTSRTSRGGAGSPRRPARIPTSVR